MEGGPPHQEPAQHLPMEVLHLLGREASMVGAKGLELEDLGLELLLQRGQSLPGVLDPLRAASHGALRWKESGLSLLEEAHRTFNAAGVAPQRVTSLGNILLRIESTGRYD